MEYITLYHGTSSEFKESISQEGINPRKESSHLGNWSKAPSREDFVYLTDTYPIYFAFAALNEVINEDELAKENLLIYKLRVQTDKLYPDEDFIYHLNKKENIAISNEECKELAIKNQKDWESSLKMLGTVGHYGKISTTQIISQVELKLEDQKDLFLVWEGIQPTISIENKLFCGQRYQELTESLFN